MKEIKIESIKTNYESKESTLSICKKKEQRNLIKHSFSYIELFNDLRESPIDKMVRNFREWSI